MYECAYMCMLSAFYRKKSIPRIYAYGLYKWAYEHYVWCLLIVKKESKIYLAFFLIIRIVVVNYDHFSFFFFAFSFGPQTVKSNFVYLYSVSSHVLLIYWICFVHFLQHRCTSVCLMHKNEMLVFYVRLFSVILYTRGSSNDYLIYYCIRLYNVLSLPHTPLPTLY